MCVVGVFVHLSLHMNFTNRMKVWVVEWLDMLPSSPPSSTALSWACDRLKQVKGRGEHGQIEYLGGLEAVCICPKPDLAICKSPCIW